MKNTFPISRFIKINYRISLVLVTLMFLSIDSSFGQSIGSYKGTDPSFNTLSEINAGATSTNYLTVQYNLTNGNYPSGWTLQVRANGNFSNGSTTVAPQYISLQFSSINGGPTGVTGTGYKTLSTGAAASLITTTSNLQTPPNYFFEHKFNMRIQGGSHLTVGTGTYAGSVTLSLVAKNGTVIATNTNVPLSFVVNYSNTCSGATISTYSSNQYTFTSYAQQTAGATVTDALSVQYNPNSASCTGWSLRVRAAGNFTNGANSVAPQYFSLRFNRVQSGSPTASAIGVTNNAVALSNTDIALINQSNAAFNPGTATEHKFDMLIQGGNHLLLPNGTYSGSLILTLYNQSNQVVSTSTVTVSFAINSNTNTYTMVLQNGADNIDMIFNTAASFTSGVSVTKSNGLKITGYSAYQVLIKTSSVNMVSGTSSNTIPVSVVSLETTQSTATTGGVLTYTRQLSNADQIIITNPLTDYTQQVVEYHLRYYTQPGDNRLSVGSGTYSTTVLFVATPR